MAFDHRGLTLIPNPAGFGGFAIYTATVSGDTLGVMTHNRFWNSDLSSLENAQNLKARTALESLVRNQEDSPSQRLPILFVDGDGNLQWRTARLSDGTIASGARYGTPPAFQPAGRIRIHRGTPAATPLEGVGGVLSNPLLT